MVYRWLFSLTHLVAFSICHVCKAAMLNPFDTLRSANKIQNGTLDLSKIPHGIESNIPAYCNGSSSWITFQASRVVPNCRAADTMLQSPKIWFWGHNEYEFVPLGVQSKLELPVMRTPLRVTSGISSSHSSPWNVDPDEQSRKYLALHHSHR